MLFDLFYLNFFNTTTLLILNLGIWLEGGNLEGPQEHMRNIWLTFLRRRRQEKIQLTTESGGTMR